MPRKQPQSWIAVFLAMASIRPRLLCRGNVGTIFEDSPLGLELQFGRGCYAAETRFRVRVGSMNEGASIRPRLLCRGNPILLVLRRRRREPLQFGRGCYAAETIRDDWGRFWAVLLQFGRGCYAAETIDLTDAGEPAILASIRPRLLCRGNSH